MFYLVYSFDLSVFISFSSSFSKEFWSCDGIWRPFRCFGTQFSLNCAFISCPFMRPCLQNNSLNSVNKLFGGSFTQLISHLPTFVFSFTPKPLSQSRPITVRAPFSATRALTLSSFFHPASTCQINAPRNSILSLL